MAPLKVPPKKVTVAPPKGGAGGLSAPMLEAAQKEWVELGHKIGDFSVDKMGVIWAQQEEQRKLDAMFKDNNNGGELAKKEHLIRRDQERSRLKPIIDRVNKGQKELKEVIIQAVRNGADALEPKALRRYRKEKIYQQRIAEQVEMAKRDRNERFQVQTRRRQEKAAAIASREAVLRKKKEAEDRREYIRLKRIADVQANQEKEWKEVNRIRKEIHDAAIAKVESGKASAKLKADQNRDRKRARDTKYWSKYHKVASKETKVLAKMNKVTQRERQEREERQPGDEDKAVADEYVRDETWPADLSTSNSQGVYGVPIGEDEWIRSAESSNPVPEGTNDPKLDRLTTELFGSENMNRQFAAIEIDKQNLESELARLGRQSDNHKGTIETSKNELIVLKELKERYEVVRNTIDEGEDEHIYALAGPPRREADLTSQQVTHNVMNRKYELVRNTNEIDAREIQLRNLIARSIKSEETIKFKTIELRAKISAKEATMQVLKDTNTGADLPVIMGVSIANADSLEAHPALNAGKFLQSTLMKSKALVLQASSSKLVEHRRAIQTSMHKQWRMREERIVVNGEIERDRTSLARLESRLVKMQKENLAKDLVSAIEKFFAEGGLKNLRPVVKVAKGFCDWWINHLESDSKNVTQYGREGVRLGSSKTGTCQGTIAMPYFALWEVTLIVTRQNERAQVGDPRDTVVLKMGTTLKTLGIVNRLYNSRPLGYPGVKHEVKYTINSATVAYSFEFTSSSDKSVEHLIVQRGKFRCHKHPPLENVTADGRVVLSDYVRQARIEAQQPTTKQAVLLAEFIEASQSTAEIWDSNLFQGCWQRFRRVVFVRLISGQLEKETALILNAKREAEQAAREAQSRLWNAKETNRLGTAGPTTAASVQSQDSVVSLELEPARNKYIEAIPPTAMGDVVDNQWPPVLPANHNNNKKTKNGDQDEERVFKNTAATAANKVAGRDGDRPSTGALTISSASSRPMTVDQLKEAERELKVLAAKKRYQDRKHGGRTLSTGEAEALVGSKVEVFDTNIQRWKFGRITSFRVEKDEDTGAEIAIRHHVVFQAGDEEDEEEEDEQNDDDLNNMTEDDELDSALMQDVATNRKEKSRASSTVRSLDPLEGEWLDLGTLHFVEVNIDTREVEAQQMQVRRSLQIQRTQLRAKREEQRKMFREEDERGLMAFEEERMRTIDKADVATQLASNAAIAETTKRVEDGDDVDMQDAILNEGRVIIGKHFVHDREGDSWETKEVIGLDEAMLQSATSMVEESGKLAVTLAGRPFRVALRSQAQAFEQLKEHRRLRRLKYVVSEKRAAEAASIGNLASQLAKVSLSMNIPNFEKCMPPKDRCMHIRHKYWGTLYAHGQKCLECGVELSKSFVADPWQMTESSTRIGSETRAHRSTFGLHRIKDQRTLITVLSERARVEKEERGVELATKHFYDRTALKGIERFDERHFLRPLWQGGGSKIQHNEYNNNENQNQQDGVTENVAKSRGGKEILKGPEDLFGALGVRQMQREAARAEFLELCARMCHFRLKIVELRTRENNLTVEIKEKQEQLAHVHADELATTDRLKLVGQEHGMCESLIERRKIAIMAETDARNDLNEALTERGKCEATEDKLRDSLLELQTQLNGMTSKLQEATPWSEMAKELKETSLEQEHAAEEELEHVSAALHSTSEKLRVQQWTRPGFLVHMPGWAHLNHVRVTAFRQGRDDPTADDRAAAFVSILTIRMQVGTNRTRCASGSGMVVKMYTPLMELMARDPLQQGRENRAMEREEKMTKKFVKQEQQREKDELLRMREEEAFLMIAFGAVDQDDHEYEAIKEVRIKAKRDAEAVIKQPWKQKQIRLIALQRAQQQFGIGIEIIPDGTSNNRNRKKNRKSSGKHNRRARKTEYTKGNVLNNWRAKLKAKKVVKEVEFEFVEEQMDLGELEVHNTYALLRVRENQENIFTQIFLEMVQVELIESVAREELEHSITSAKRLMADLKLYIPIQGQIGFHVYNQLALTWRERRAELEELHAHIDVDLSRLQEEEDQKLLDDEERLEREREEEEMIKMAEEEVFLRSFYRKERQMCMAERWAMADEEQLTKAVLKQEAMDAVKSKYEVVGDKKPEPKTRNAKRRDEVKKQLAEKQRAGREQKGMAVEDKLSYEMRQADIRRRQQAMMEMEMKLNRRGSDDGDSDDEDGDLARLGAFREDLELKRIRAKAKAKRLEDERIWERETQAAFRDKVGYQLKLMHTQESLWYAREKSRNAVHVMRRVDTRIKQIVKEFNYLERELSKMQENMHLAKTAALNAMRHVEMARPAFRSATKFRVYEVRHTTTMDSFVLHQAKQRFETDRLYEDLHRLYFYLVMGRLASRAEIIAKEREIGRLVDELEAIHEERIAKQSKLNRLGKKHLRDSRYGMYRSQIAKLCFGIERAKTLKRAFTGWSQVARKQAATRIMTQVQISLEKHRLDVQRAFEGASVVDAKRRMDQEAMRAEESQPGITTMQRHRNRILKCRNCQEEFTQALNHEMVCTYHGGSYALACPQTCERARGREPGSVDTKCMAHYRRRWSCCDQVDPGAFGKGGCKRRWHMAADFDPRYEKMVQDAEGRSEERIKAAEAEKAYAHRWVSKAQVQGHLRMEQIKSGLDKDRELVKEFKNLKFV